MKANRNLRMAGLPALGLVAARRWMMKVSGNASCASRAAHPGLRLSALLGFVVPFFFLSGTTPARAASTAVTTCGQVLSAAGDYELTHDLGPCEGDGVVIAASGVHLTLAGHTISGLNPPSVCDFRTTKATQVGVRAEGPFTDVRINGGTVTGFVSGIRLVGIPTSFIKFNVTAMTVTDSCILGTVAAFAQNGRIATSVAKGNGLDGIALVGASVSGICFPCIQNITVESNDASANARFGILNEGNSITMRENVVNGNAALPTGAGIGIFGDNNTIDRNSANNNKLPSGFGIVLEQGVQGNVITGNTANGNVTGIDVEQNASSNTVQGNIAHGNSSADLNDSNSACDSNIWKGNNFDTATVAGGPNPGCIR